MIWFRSINKTLEYFDSCTVRCLFFDIHIVTDKDSQRQILRANTSLSRLNKIFNNSHGLQNSIDTINTSNQLWKILHKSLVETLNKTTKNLNENLMRDIFNKHVYANLGTSKSYVDFIDEFSLDWFEAVFGSDFKNIRSQVLAVLNYTFYTNPYRKVPYVGEWISWYRRQSKQKEIDSIKQQILSIIKRSNNFNKDNETFVSHFYKALSKSDQIDLDNTFVDNIFLSVLTYDFINSVMKGIMIRRITTNDKIDPVDISDFIAENFLFQFRARVLNTDLTLDSGFTFKKGDVCIMNLAKSKLVFSYGLRHCPGEYFSKRVLTAFISLINSTDFTCSDSYYLTLKFSDSDVPNYESMRNVHGTIRTKNLLKESSLIPIKNDKIPLKNLWHLYADSKLMGDCINVFSQTVEFKYEYDIIIAPEARALVLAGMINKHHLPIIVLTKSDKFGQTLTEDYTRGYSSNSTTLHLYKSFEPILKGKRVLLVDDGIASGCTTLTCINLIKQMEAVVKCVFVLVKHNYCDLTNYDDYLPITHWCYDL